MHIEIENHEEKIGVSANWTLEEAKLVYEMKSNTYFDKRASNSGCDCGIVSATTWRHWVRVGDVVKWSRNQI